MSDGPKKGDGPIIYRGETWPADEMREEISRMDEHFGKESNGNRMDFNTIGLVIAALGGAAWAVAALAAG